MATYTSTTSAAVLGGTPAAPPPTPSIQPLSNDSSVTAISSFLHNVLLLNPSPPSLSLPSRLSPSSPPLISLLSHQPHRLLSAATNLGLFHLTDHSIPTALPASAVLQSSDFLLSSPTLTDLGFSDDDNEDADMVFDVLSEKLAAMPAVAELGRRLVKVGLRVVDMLAAAGGLPEDPFGSGKAHARCLIWVSSANGCPKEEEMLRARKRYPYVVGLEYEMRERKGPWSVLGDSGEWTAFAPRADSVLVTIGDIAQVWSNGRFKKVRGIQHQTSPQADGCDYSNGITISVLVTLNMDSIVEPLAVRLESDGCDGEADEGGDGANKSKRKFRSFAFEEYAWRVYNERFPFKDPLLRYRI